MDWTTLLLIAVLSATFYLFAEVRSLRTRIHRLERNGGEVGNTPFSPELDEEISRLVHQGKTVEAVKRVREEHGWTLLEAKQAVDRYQGKEV